MIFNFQTRLEQSQAVDHNQVQRGLERRLQAGWAAAGAAHQGRGEISY